MTSDDRALGCGGDSRAMNVRPPGYDLVPLGANVMYGSNIARAAEAISKADALLITAGAGLGVDSGFPDFRGSQGFWNAYPPYAKLGIEFYDLACPETLQTDPALFWGFYEHRRALYCNTEPHPGYHILREMAHARSSFVFTSNVDGHFARAGFSQDQIVECHGTIHSRQCAAPCSTEIWRVTDGSLVIDPSTMRTQEPFPRCSHCGGPARPNVLMFDDDAWVDARTATQFVCYRKWLQSIRGARPVVLEVGAGTALPTVRNEGEAVAARHRGTHIRINPREADNNTRDGISLQGNALDVLNALSAVLRTGA